MLNNINIKSEFVRSIVVLTSGTALAQIVSYIATPFITRLFTPDEMGELGVFMRITAFITAIAAARYELTIPLPKSDYHAFQLFRLSIRISLLALAVSTLFGFGYWFWLSFDTNTLLLIILVIVGSFFMIFRNIGTNWAIRNKRFKSISYSGIVGSSTSNGIKIVAGLLNFGVIGLIIGHVIGAGAAVIAYIRNYLNQKKEENFHQSKVKMKVLAKDYADFPKFSLPHTLLDNGRELLVAFLIVQFFDSMVFGSYDHSFRMLQLPLILIGTAMGQVFLNRCSVLYANNEKIYPLLKKTMFSLFLLSIIPFSLIFFFGESIFVLVFGENWAYSGKISEIIAPWLMVNFIFSPLSTVPSVIGKQKLFLGLGVINSVIQLSGFGCLPLLLNKGLISQNELFWIISIAMTLYHIAIILVKLRVTKLADARNR